MVVGFTTTYAISAYHHWCCEFESRLGLGVQHYVIKVCQWLATGQWFSLCPPVSSTNKTDRHDITEILFRVALNTIKKQTNIWLWSFSSDIVLNSWPMVSESLFFILHLLYDNSTTLSKSFTCCSGQQLFYIFMSTIEKTHFDISYILDLICYKHPNCHDITEILLKMVLNTINLPINIQWLLLPAIRVQFSPDIYLVYPIVTTLTLTLSMLLVKMNYGHSDWKRCKSKSVDFLLHHKLFN